MWKLPPEVRPPRGGYFARWTTSSACSYTVWLAALLYMIRYGTWAMQMETLRHTFELNRGIMIP